MRALVVEDEKPLREQLEKRLRASGYAVDTAADGDEGLYFGREYPVDVAVVDIGLPKRSGIEVVRRWREDGRDFPVLILTARGRWQDKVDGLEAGADDYLVKPFHMEELLARLRALVRRSSGFSQNIIECGPFRLDTGSRRVEAEGEAVELTAYEYKVLEYLMMHPGQVVSKSQLAEHVYDEDLDPESNVLEVLVGRLRKKLDPDRRHNPIETRRGQGYQFRFEEKQA
ncbi:MAG: response regulator transcription factor [Gammaproteobacteria bacterium]|nr:response regulator transcription factor [Gammaproteobacteria bacterium]